MAENEFGYTLWGMDWVRLAEPIRQTRPEPLLPRARSIARNYGVQTTVSDRVVSAHIHRGGAASVTHVEVAPLPRPQISAIREIIGDPVVFTDADRSALRDAGIDGAPILAGTDCSCRARTDRCVHVLATYYDMARRVDENPRLALEIQGFYATATAPAEARNEPEPRWIPISTLDPAAFFDSPATT